jgi:hypothetical protein
MSREVLNPLLKRRPAARRLGYKRIFPVLAKARIAVSALQNVQANHVTKIKREMGLGSISAVRRRTGGGGGGGGGGGEMGV